MKYRLCAILLVMVVTMMPMLGCVTSAKEGDIIRTAKLVAMKSNSSLVGDAVFLSGTSFGEEDYYKYYVENTDGSYSFEKIQARDSFYTTVLVYEEDRQEGLLVVKVGEAANYKVYEFHIPRGSLVREIRIGGN